MGRYDYHKRNLGDSQYGSRSPKKKNKVLRMLVLLLVFAFIGALFIYVFPEVEVTIVPETEGVVGDYDVLVDGGLDTTDILNNKIPGEVVTLEDSMEKIFGTTGEKNIGDRATGEVVFYNQTGLTQPLTVGNSLVSDDGVVFNLVANTEIPNAQVSAEGSIVYGTLAVQIIAKEAGEEGNIVPGRLTIIDLPFSKQNKIYGEVKTKLGGGTSKVIKVVSQDDLDKAEKKIRELLEPELRGKIENKLSREKQIYDDSVKFEVTRIEKAVELEEEVEEFKVKINARAEALVWDELVLRDLILGKIEQGVVNDKQLVETSQDVFDIKIEEFDFDKKTARLKIHTENQMSMPIDIEVIRDELKGKSEFEARRMMLGKENIKDVRFKFSYSITNKIPNNGNRINIKLNFK